MKLKNGSLEIDNNEEENAIRTLALGRKDYLSQEAKKEPKEQLCYIDSSAHVKRRMQIVLNGLRNSLT